MICLPTAKYAVAQLSTLFIPVRVSQLSEKELLNMHVSYLKKSFLLHVL